MRLLDGKVAVVSGAGPGCGRAIAVALAEAGAAVCVTSRHPESYAAVCEELRSGGAVALGVAADITKPEDRQRIVDCSLDSFGRIDILVNNAFAMGPIEPLLGCNVESAWRAAFKVNVFATVALTQAVVPAMRAAGGGSVVMIASLAGRRPESGMAGYGASKAALLHAAQSLAAELGADRIRVNSVVPSHIDGPNLRAYFRMQAEARGVAEDEIYRETADLGVLPTVTTAAEVASVVTFFASDMASAVTGQSLDVNGGQWFG